MKFACSVDINLPREKVVALFDNPENMKEWQDGFVSFEPLFGEPGQPGATAKLTYKYGKRDMVLIETVLENKLPDEMSGIYDHKHMRNHMRAVFTELAPDRTRYTSHVEYTALRGFMIKAIAFLMPSTFKKQVQKWMNQFKDFAERQ